MRIKETIRRWKLDRQIHRSIDEIAGFMSAMTRGWISYYSKFGKTDFRKVMDYLNGRLARWAIRKYKRFKGKYAFSKARNWLANIAKYDRAKFVHWMNGFIPYYSRFKIA